MGQGDTTIRMDFEVGGASAAKMTVMDVYRSQQDAMKKTAAAAKQLAEQQGISQRDASKAIKAHSRIEQQEIRNQARAIREKARETEILAKQQGIGNKLLGRGLMAGALGIAGYAGVAGVQSVLSGVGQGIQGFIDKRKELEDAITPIVALEDNVSRMGAIREQVVSTATALGRSYQEVGQFYSDLVGSTGNLSNMERESLIKETKELSQLTGGSLVTAQNLLTKSYQIYGKELVNVNQLQNKLMVTQDQGAITFEDMALRLPELLQTGKFADLNIDEVLGTVIGATRKSGSIEKTMTGMRNFFLIMEEAQKKGVTLTGSYTQKLQQLAAMFQSNAPKMQELFGKEVVVHASSVTDAIFEITGAIQNLGTVSGEADAVFDKLLKKATDPAFQQMQTFNTYDQVAKNAANIAGNMDIIDTPMLRMLEAGEAGSAHVAIGTSGRLSPWMNKVGGYVGAALLPGFAQEGRDMSQATMEMPDFIASKRVDFFRKKQEDLADVEARSMRASGVIDDVQFARERQEIMGRTLSPHLMTDSERAARIQTGATPTSSAITGPTSFQNEGTSYSEWKAAREASRATVDALNENSARLRENTAALNGPVLTNMKAGGGRLNSEEGL